MPAATVLIPTHDHGPTLRHSVASALNQTAEDFEVLVVGDGVPEVTRELMGELAGQDDRVRFLDRPKGEHRGERLRHDAISEARSEIVCYLADDDLWLPTHLEELLPLLAHADFVAAPAAVVGPRGDIHAAPVQLAAPFVRERLMAGKLDLPLSCVGHTVAAYRGHPTGWVAPPAGRGSGLTMWQRFLEQPGLRAAAGDRVTVLNFKSTEREDVSAEGRALELESWAKNLGDPGAELDLTRATLASALAGWHRCEAEHHSAERHAQHLEELLAAGAFSRSALASRVLRRIRGLLRRS